MITVIISLYNKEHFIEKTLNSVLNQTYKDFELLVINDGSTDSSAEIVARHKDPRIRLINQENKGVSATRNHGIQLAKGSFIAFLDADDLWHPQFLEKLYGLYEEHPEQSFFCCAQKDRIINTLPLGVSIIEDHCKYDYIYFTGGSLIRRSVFDEVGNFREGVQLGEDRDMWLKIGCKYPTVYLNEGLMAHSADTENNLSRIVDVTKSFPYWEWYDYAYPFKQSLYHYATNMIVENAKSLIAQKRYSEALAQLGKCRGYRALRPRIRLYYDILMRH